MIRTNRSFSGLMPLVILLTALLLVLPSAALAEGDELRPGPTSPMTSSGDDSEPFDSVATDQDPHDLGQEQEASASEESSDQDESTVQDEESTDSPDTEQPAQADPDEPDDQPTSRETDLAGAPAEPTSSITASQVVTLQPATTRNLSLSIAGTPTAKGSLAALAASSSLAIQRFRLEPIAGTSYCLIRNVGSQMVLDAMDGNATDGGTVQQQTPADTLAQRWTVTKVGDDYAIVSALAAADGSLLALSYDEVTGAVALGPWDPDHASDSNALWHLCQQQVIADGTYRLTPGIAPNRALDIEGGSVSAGANARSYNSNGSSAQRYTLSYNAQTGYYTIAVVSSGMVLDVAGGSTDVGANVQQWRPNGSEAQQWAIEDVGNGSYRIASRKSGLVLDVAGGSTASGANVRLWRSNGSKAQQWSLASVSPIANGLYTIRAFDATSLCLDVKGGKTVPYTSLQLYSSNGSAAQIFEVLEYRPGLYTIRSTASGLYVSVQHASATARTDVDLEGGPAMDDGRLWRAFPGAGGIVFVSTSGLALDISGGAIRKGTNIWGYTRNNTASQRFALKGVNGSLLGPTQVRALLPTSDGTSQAHVDAQIVGGQSYLMLPSYTSPSSVSLQVLATREGCDVEYATSKTGSYTTLGSEGTLNLDEGFKKDGDGAYQVWLRTKGTGEARLVRVMVSANLRSVFVTSSDPYTRGRSYVEAQANKHTNEASGSIIVVTAKGQSVYDGGLSQIRGRGNSTWTQEKKPYQIKLSKKASLLDGTDQNKAKAWVLLANTFDATMERDYVSKKLALSLGLSNTPDCEYVDLYYDGEYRGTYQLSEKVQAATGRIEIHDLEDDNEALNGDTSGLATATAKNSYGRQFQYVKGMKDPSDITGGYIVEVDTSTYRLERCWFDTSIGHFSLKMPDDASYAQVKYISEYVQRAIDEGKKPSGNLGKYVDLTSLAKTTIVNEVAKNPDWLRYASTFYYKDKGASSLLYAGPVWDFDLAFGVARQDEDKKFSFMSVEGMVCETYGFYGSNTQFKNALKSAYKAGASKVKAIASGGSSGKGQIGDTATLLGRSMAMNRKLWPYKTTEWVPLQMPSTDDALSHLWTWTAARINWLDNHLAGSTSPAIGMGAALSGTYTIVGGTGRVLDVAGGSTANGANIQTWSSNGSTAQRFTIKARGKSASGEWYYTITNVKSGKVLEAAGGSTALTTNVRQYAYNGSAGQHWILRSTSSAGTGRYQIVNLKSGLSLDIGGGTNANGANVLLYMVCGNNAAQNWFLRKV